MLRYVVIEEIGLDIWSKNSEFCFDMQILRKIGLDMQIIVESCLDMCKPNQTKLNLT